MSGAKDSELLAGTVSARGAADPADLSGSGKSPGVQKSSQHTPGASAASSTRRAPCRYCGKTCRSIYRTCATHRPLLDLDWRAPKEWVHVLEARKGTASR